MAESRVSRKELLQKWEQAWPLAMKLWNPFVALREPFWCFSVKEAKNEGLEGSFAMIRLSDHRIVIDLDAVQKNRVQDYGLQILAHEIGHHVLIPANLYDNAGLFRRMRLALAGIESRVPLVANLYSDLIINDCLQRVFELDMAGVYKKIQEDAEMLSPLHIWYMRTYEYLWGLKRGTISGSLQKPEIDADASLAASIIRSYARNWLDGAGRYALLAYPYLMEEQDFLNAGKELKRYLDAEKSGQGAESLGGMAEIDESILEGIVDPRSEVLGEAAEAGQDGSVRGEKSGRRPEILNGRSLEGGAGPEQRYLEPGVYIDMMRQIDPNADENKLVNRYYRDIAVPYLVPFPSDESKPLADLLPEGTDQWEPGDPVEELDWFETTVVSPVVVPGITTRRRIYSQDFDTPSK
ncbi:MAG: hypothetical protein ACOYXC_13270, partial [Candidatus Rifleibacteriota bacterium]